jgi:hypothetical protein
VVQAGTSPNSIAVLNVNGGTDVVDSGGRVDLLTTTTGSYYYGVDVLAVSPDGTRGYAGNPYGGTESNVALIDLVSLTLEGGLPAGLYPAGIAIGGKGATVQARAEVPSLMPQSCRITSHFYIDMTASPAPDDKLGSFTGSLAWDPTLLSYASHSGPLSGFTGAVNVSAAAGTLTFNGAKPDGAPGDVEVLRVLFDVVGSIGTTPTLDLGFSAMAAASTFANLLPALGVTDGTGTISQAGFLGDVNGDNLVNSTDALIILSYDVGLSIPQAYIDRINGGFGDPNSDGLTNSTDALIVLSYDAGMTVPFPVGQGVCP